MKRTLTFFSVFVIPIICFGFLHYMFRIDFDLELTLDHILTSSFVNHNLDYYITHIHDLLPPNELFDGIEDFLIFFSFIGFSIHFFIAFLATIFRVV